MELFYNIKIYHSREKELHMKSIISKYFAMSIFVLVALTANAFAASDLPVSKQVKKDTKDEKIEIVPEIKIEAQSSTTAPKNPKLKDGKACNFDDLEEVQGELFTEIPMAKTEPCDTVDCKNLKAAKMLKDDYVELKTAETISCDKDK